MEITLEANKILTLQPGFTEQEFEEFLYLLFFDDMYCDEKEKIQE